ncbi:hypothetical protein FHS83_001720 [Rhizomicrobium palustre]|uniref:DUF1365 domain-containing protein n=1 Tax=Rhizomicrobium palustre TaxID=189966 RepID=A0A846MZH0_9PROT|nr:DUF1365 domain-containing protein [Rhizomicrobium palustre]NIK88402.1 hypothetical protein [Rhizomicrobium palustre]
MTPALYAGTVMHRRYKQRHHAFRYRVFWGLFDLDEMGAQGLRLFSYNRPNLFSLYDRDHGDGSDTPLRRQVDVLLARHGLDLRDGKVFLLAMPRTLGYSFNPLSLYFCHDAGSALKAVIYQVHNTFGGRHHYVQMLDHAAPQIRFSCAKNFYVSPFLEMDLAYRFRLTLPGERVAVAIQASEAGRAVLDAALTAERRPFTDWALFKLALSIPAVTLKVIAAIHWEAVRLRIKGIAPNFPEVSKSVLRK